MPGRQPFVHEVPLLVDVEKQMFDDPPSLNRPVCAAVTIVDPNENESGSTCVRC